MKVLRSALIVLLGLFFSLPSFSQMTEDPTAWSFEAKKTGDNQYDLIVHLKLKEHWHIWAFDPGGDGLQVPPEIIFTKNPAVKKEGGIKEKGKKVSKDVEGVDGTVHYFENKVDYIQKVTVTGNTTIKGSYRYQVCNESMCLPPKTKKFSIEIKDATPAGTVATPDTANQDTLLAGGSGGDNGLGGNAGDGANEGKGSDSSAVSGDQQSSSNGTPGKEETMPLWLLFLLALAGGFGAIVTPCVYSMIPITVSFFTKRSKTRQEGIRNALYYSLSIIIIFTVLGIIISALFGPQALYKLSTNWIANLFFFVLFVVFGISFLGAFEITLPSSWTSKTDSKANTKSFTGIFFMALTLAIVSFSCTGPIVGPLLVAAGQGGLAGPAVGMFGFSLGLALPFAVFAVFPGLLNKMASSGGWLNQVKVTLGFIELALALKFLSNADLVKGWRILDREIFIALWIVIAVLLGIYLLGKLKLSHDDANVKNVYGQEYVSIFKLFLAGASFCFALYLLPGMWGAPLKGMGQFIPPMGTFDPLVGQSAGPAHSSELKPVKYVKEMSLYEPDVVRNNGLVTYFDYEEALEASKKLNKPLMLDFTGITCVNCRRMETSVWSNPEVMKRLKNDFVIVSLYCDATEVELVKGDEYVSKRTNEEITNLGDKCLDLQIGRFGSNSQPFYFYEDGKGNRLADKGYGYDPNVQKFIQHLENVKAKYKELNP